MPGERAFLLAAQDQGVRAASLGLLKVGGGQSAQAPSRSRPLYPAPCPAPGRS